MAGEEKIPVALSHKTRDQVITKLSSIHDLLFTITMCRNETDTIVFSAAHLLTDARGLLQIAATIADQYRDAEKMPEKICSAGDRRLDAALEQFSPDQIQKFCSAERTRCPGPHADKKYFQCEGEASAEQIVIRQNLSPVTGARIKTFAKRYGATVHDILLAAYGTALREYVLSVHGVDLKCVPLCSTVDLRPYVPARRSGIMNYTVAYWTPVACGKKFTETVTAVTRMSREIKSNAIGIGAAEPFFGTKLAPAGSERFACVPFFTNPGLIADQVLEFGPGLSVQDINFAGVIHNGAPFSLGAWTWNGVLHLSITTGVGADASTAVLKKNGGDSPRALSGSLRVDRGRKNYGSMMQSFITAFPRRHTFFAAIRSCTTPITSDRS